MPFRGLAVFVLGDMMQLKSCMGRYICQEPINNDFKVTHALAPRWLMFKCILLETNHQAICYAIYSLNKRRKRKSGGRLNLV